VELFNYTGPCEIIHSDQGREFVNEVCETLSVTYNYSIRVGEPYTPRMQGKVEKFNNFQERQTGKLMTQEKLEKETACHCWVNYVASVTRIYNNCKHENGMIPFEAFHCTQQLEF
jgi:hypothetical protein